MLLITEDFNEDLFLAEWNEFERLTEIKGYGVIATTIMLDVLGVDACTDIIRSEYEGLKEA